ncbi:MAG TPA: anhydro-N-acetylmuramic acid kinase [Humisphaera sp.]|jgi:anhydro-N-acetylmuramic acid kinase|nr:anhydro-N-acetylmuramic acid kinase [Humisphaera sp.]
MHERILAGAMSGTSADGIDIAIVRITGRGLEMSAQLLHHHAAAYSLPLRGRILDLRSTGKADLRSLAQLSRDISLEYAEAIRDALEGAKISPDQVKATAAHGQTLFHDPPLTIQWLDPSLLAAQTGCAVVSDFRRADLAAGGQGAPLVPFADYILFRDANVHRILLNIGGIANLTSIPPRCTFDQLIAFDTGPGNCISDWICRMFGSPGMSCDADGAGASRGTLQRDIMRQFLADAYFTAPAPKSTDGPAMIAAFERALPANRTSVDDLLATAAAITSATIKTAITQVTQSTSTRVELVVSGGGVHNQAMMNGLRRELGTSITIRRTDDLGIPAEAKEAIAFALLGAATLDGEPSNVPSVTGASKRVILGSITPKPCGR